MSKTIEYVGIYCVTTIPQSVYQKHSEGKIRLSYDNNEPRTKDDHITGNTWILIARAKLEEPKNLPEKFIRKRRKRVYVGVDKFTISNCGQPDPSFSFETDRHEKLKGLRLKLQKGQLEINRLEAELQKVPGITDIEIFEY